MSLSQTRAAATGRVTIVQRRLKPASRFSLATNSSPSRSRHGQGSGACRLRRVVKCSAEGDASAGPRPTRLGTLVQRKHQEIGQLLRELGDEGVEQRMQSALQNPIQPRFLAAQALSAPRMMGMPAVILELKRGTMGGGAEQLLQRAMEFESSGMGLRRMCAILLQLLLAILRSS